GGRVASAVASGYIDAFLSGRLGGISILFRRLRSVPPIPLNLIRLIPAEGTRLAHCPPCFIASILSACTLQGEHHQLPELCHCRCGALGPSARVAVTVT